MPLLKEFRYAYRKEDKEIHVFLEWQDKFFPPHRFIISADNMEILVAEDDDGWQDASAIRGNYHELIWTADRHFLDFVALVRVLEKELGRKLEFS